jgi:hypothetical protein
MREPVFAPISREGYRGSRRISKPLTETTSWPSHDVEQRRNE